MFKYLMDHRMADVEERIKVRECLNSSRVGCRREDLILKLVKLVFFPFWMIFLSCEQERMKKVYVKQEKKRKWEENQGV